MIIIWPRCVRFKKIRNRLKVLNLSFQTVFEILKTDTTRPSYDPLKFSLFSLFLKRLALRIAGVEVLTRSPPRIMIRSNRVFPEEIDSGFSMPY